VLSTFTRYCPQCLAGDGSAIQQRHGGPWKTEWRLAVSFVCRDHRAFLRHLCPSCRRPAHKFDARAGSRLLPFMQFKDLHPGQCRNLATDEEVLDLFCGARLDAPPASPRLPAAPSALLHLQDRIGALLDGAGSSQAARTYFTDLRILSAIVLATWPLAMEFNPAPLSKAIESDLSRHHRKLSVMPVERRNHTWDRPPESAIASAALLHTADQILALDQNERDEAIRSMIRSGPAPDSGRWGRTNLALVQASAPFQKAVRQAQEHRSRNLGRGPGRRLDPNLYRPEHVPQWLPDHWLQHPNGERLTAHLHRPMHRRAAAVQLIQMMSDMSVQEAELFLGIQGTYLELGDGDHRLPVALLLNDRELEVLANRSREAICPTDYRHRRKSLPSWTLPQSHWATIWQQIAPRPGTTPPHDGPRKHQAASEFVWARVTGSERPLAPRIPVLPPQLRHRKSWASLADALATPGPNTHYSQLSLLLANYADELAAVVDRNPHGHIRADTMANYESSQPSDQ
ncbi:TniQ family protein, partial [Streptomyces sp. NPDC051555]|uniref:TniQ family protein n=1 Tax=Streptomyces sp. NPDC051555 TaxID=3365657 RepID=UPI00379883FF